MKKINPMVAAGLILIALVVVIVVMRRTSAASDANGASLIPPPRPGSPTFAPNPEDIEAGKSKTRKAPDANAGNSP